MGGVHLTGETEICELQPFLGGVNVRIIGQVDDTNGSMGRIKRQQEIEGHVDRMEQTMETFYPTALMN